MSGFNPRPPKVADRFLELFFKEHLLEEIKGDLHEYFKETIEEKGNFKASIGYWKQLFLFVRPFAIKSIVKNSILLTMYKSYFKFAWRNLLKHKNSTALKLVSLCLGIATFLFTAIYVKNELSYDQFHRDADLIYRVPIDFVDDTGKRLPDATTPPALAPALMNSFPEVNTATRLFPNWGSKFLLGTSLDHRFYEETVIRTDSLFFEVFSFPLLYGDVETALSQPNNLLVSREMALKYFGREDVVGETLTWYADEQQDLTITGVLENVPVTSHFKFDFLMRLTYDGIDQNWGWYNYYTYMKLNEGAQITILEPKLQPFYEEQVDETDFYNQIYSQPLTDIHLHSNLKWELEANGNVTNVYIFSILAVFVLFISCLNYLNITIAESVKRFKEVGVRKVFGANKGMVLGQFLVETLLVTIIAFVLASVLSEVLLRQNVSLLGVELSLLTSKNLLLFLTIGLIVVGVGLLAGLFPAIYAFSIRSIIAMKGEVNKQGQSAMNLRKGLLVIQFAVSALMIFGTLAVQHQLQHMQQSDKGFGVEQVVIIENGRSIDQINALKSELRTIPGVEQVGIASGVIGGLNWTTRLGYPDAFVMNYVVTDPEYLEAMDFELVAGRSFSRSHANDTVGFTIIVNETALDELGFTFDDVGESRPLVLQNDTAIVNGTVIGVVKDFHFTDYRQSIKPFAFFYREGPMDNLSLKLATSDLRGTLDKIESTWSSFSNGVAADYYFLDEKFQQLFDQEARLSKLLIYLSVLAIAIAVMGMFSIANLTIKSKVKEIAIRKVLGASVSTILQLIGGRFMLLVLISNVIACPLAYYFVTRWLETFEYRTVIGPWLFVLVIGVTVAAAILSVGFQSIKAALSNPVDSLRNE